MRYPETQMPDIFRAFGGGGNVCLGRHFARAIVPGTIATLLLGFDFESFDGEPVHWKGEITPCISYKERG